MGVLPMAGLEPGAISVAASVLSINGEVKFESSAANEKLPAWRTAIAKLLGAALGEM